jgi:serine/threonine protein kinase
MTDLPKSIGPYRVLRLIGAGGMGQIYECVTAGGATVAVKTVLDEYRGSAQVRARFRAEIAAAKLVRGPYVADYFDSDPEELWLAIRFYPWPSLREHVEAQGPLSVHETALLALKVAEALQHIHAEGIVHRDVTPSNILYQNGDVLLIDYGISKKMTVGGGYGLTGAGLPPHSWHYASPEHMAGQPLLGTSDFFSLGCVLGFAATGHQLLDDARRPRHAAVPPPLQSLVRALTSTEPGNRPDYEGVLRRAQSLLATDTNPTSPYRPHRAIAASSQGPNHLEVFVADAMPGRIRHRWFADDTWSEWFYMNLPSRYSGQHVVYMAATSRIHGNSEIFLSLDDGTILHRWYWTDAGWSGWTELDHGVGPQALAASSAGGDHLEVFTTNGQQIRHRWHRVREPAGWSDWRVMTVPEAHWPPSMHKADGPGAVAALSAAGTPGGFEVREGNQVAFVARQHLAVSFADGCTFARVYSREKDRWTDWSQIAVDAAHVAAWNNHSAGIALCLAGSEDTHFTEVIKALDDRPFGEMEDVMARPLPSPWASKNVMGMASTSREPHVVDYFLLFEDFSVIHWMRGHGRNPDRVFVLRPARTLAFPS